MATSAGREKMTLRYPDGPHDAEALLVEPRDGTIAIVTKDFAGPRARLRRPGTAPRPRTLELGLGRRSPPATSPPTAARSTLRGYDKAYIWTRRERVPRARLKRKPCIAAANLLAEGQGEALALSRDGRTFWTVPEGPRPALRRYGR